ncbi:hypothetical protein CR513_40059, partial [Mucuna pruriens]
MAKMMLNDNSISKQFWVKVVNTTCYLHNKICIRPILKKIPYELQKSQHILFLSLDVNQGIGKLSHIIKSNRSLETLKIRFAKDNLQKPRTKLKNIYWVEFMKEELDQFRKNKVRKLKYEALSNGCENDFLNGIINEEVYVRRPPTFITDSKPCF